MRDKEFDSTKLKLSDFNFKNKTDSTTSFFPLTTNDSNNLLSTTRISRLFLHRP